MTREEQIITASQLYAKHQQKPFMDGAMWADKHPYKAFPDEAVNVVGNYNKACKHGKEKS